MLLSPRIFHFGENQIYWQCQELQACEALPTGIPTATSMPLGMIDYRGIKKRFNSQLNLCKIGIWNTVVEMYSQRSLTKGSFGSDLKASDSVQNTLIRSDLGCTASKF